jgi:hypothetical protein
MHISSFSLLRHCDRKGQSMAAGFSPLTNAASPLASALPRLRFCTFHDPLHAHEYLPLRNARTGQSLRKHYTHTAATAWTSDLLIVAMRQRTL